MQKRKKYFYTKLWNTINPDNKITEGDGFCIHHINGDFTDNSIENLQKISIKAHGRLHNLGKKNKPCSEETKQKIRLTKIGNKNPAKRSDVRKKMSEARMGKEPWNKGGSFSKESKLKMSISRKGKPHPHKGTPKTNAQKEALSKIRKGEKWSAERRKAQPSKYNKRHKNEI